MFNKKFSIPPKVVGFLFTVYVLVKTLLFRAVFWFAKFDQFCTIQATDLLKKADNMRYLWEKKKLYEHFWQNCLFLHDKKGDSV